MMIWATLLACTGSLPTGEVTIDTQTEVPLIAPIGWVGRPRRRMNVDQVALAIEDVTGHAWTEDDVPLFEHLSGTLGKPEYLDSTEEDLSPGLLFQKFVDDAAKQTCGRRISDDAVANPEDRLFITLADPSLDPDSTRATLQQALLRFHGREVEAGHPDLARWEWLVNTAYERTGTSTVAWRAVCVGLITHPDFYSY